MKERGVESGKKCDWDVKVAFALCRSLQSTVVSDSGVSVKYYHVFWVAKRWGVAKFSFLRDRNTGYSDYF